MAVAIRNARPEEVADVLPAYEWLFAPPGARPPQWDPSAAADRLRAAIEAENAVVLVAVAGQGIVGLCTAYEDLLSVRFGRRVWIEDLAVHPDRRSEGVGKRLLDAAKAWARDRGATHLELDSAEGRTDAHRFYEREGPSWHSTSYGWWL
jgi:GNAT superfamily N-acetyltransferase